MSEIWTIARLIRWTTQYFDTKGMDTPRLDAELLLAHVLQKKRIYLYANYDEMLNPGELAQYRELIKKRAGGLCVAVLTGEKDFMGLTFHVDETVLIPRPDTEAWLEKLIQRCRGQTKLRVADLGTGSGAILLSFLYYCRLAKGTGIDISEDALRLAEENGRSLALDGRVEWRKGDYLSAVKPDELFDGLISNPPYIPDGDIEALSAEVRNEPRLALAGGPDGLDFYRRMAEDGWKHICPGGFCAVEFGAGQAEDVKHILDGSGRFSDYEIIKDLNGLERALFCRRI